MRNFKKLLSILLVGSLVLMCSCSKSSGAKSTADTSSNDKTNVIKIGVFEPQTGENGGGGIQEVYGIRYANQVYKTITINGTEYTIDLVEVDNKSDKTEAVNAASKLVAEKVSVVLGSYGSGVSIAAGETFADAKIPAIGCSCTNPQVTNGNPYYFRVCYLDPFQGKVMANYANDLGYKNAAVISQLGDDYSSGLASFFKDAFTSLGGTIVSDEKFQTNQTDFKAILTNIKKANPDFIFAPSSITTAPMIIQQARELGIEAKFAGGDTWENETVIKNANGHADGAVLSTFYDEADTGNEETQKFVKGFKPYLDQYEKDENIPAVSALGYDAYLTAYKAIEAAQSAKGEDIQRALVSLKLTGVTGDISFDENGDAKKDTSYIKVVKGNKFVFEKKQQTDKK